MSWEAINQAYVYGVLLGYEVRFAKDDGSSPTWVTNTLDPNTYNITLSNLEYFTGYKVVVCAKTSKGCGKEYSAISYTWGEGELVSFRCFLGYYYHLASSSTFPKSNDSYI